MEKQKILIADDSEMNRALLVDILEDQYDIVEADNGAAAIDLLTQCGGDFSLLLLDIMMPEMDGFEAKRLFTCAALRWETIFECGGSLWPAANLHRRTFG